MDLRNSRILIVCPVKNEASRLREGLLSILSQDYDNLILHIIDNFSDDGTLEIAKSIALNDSRVFVSSTKTNLSVNRSWEFALGASLEEFHSDYLMFFGGDDGMIENSFLTTLINLMKLHPTLMGAIPKFVDQNGCNKIEMKLQSFGNNNRYELCKNWGYVHAIYGMYKRECWEEIYFYNRESFNKGVEFDWWVTFYLFKFSVAQIQTAHYLKFNKLLPYDSAYYLSNEYVDLLPKKSVLLDVLPPLRDLIVHFKRTKSHFGKQHNFFNLNSKPLVLKIIIVFFTSGLCAIASAYYNAFKGKFMK
jgi:glycosyltransferase involved in cell wall biosynthesis